MTNEETIFYMTLYKRRLEASVSSDMDEDIKAFDTAIKALEQQPCEDAVSRQAVIKLLSYDWANRPSHKAVESVRNLPSVTPKEKTGKWIKTQSGDDMFPEIIVCSKCNNENSHLDFNEHSEPIGKVFIKSKYCPNCGARMVSE